MQYISPSNCRIENSSAVMNPSNEIKLEILLLAVGLGDVYGFGGLFCFFNALKLALKEDTAGGQCR